MQLLETTVALVVCHRVGGPLVLRQLLNWLSGYEATDGDTEVCNRLAAAGVLQNRMA